MSIGQTLAEARQRVGLTVADVSQRTRIRQGIIRGIEADDFSECGGDFYARGHIRSIAKVVAADPAALVREYDRSWREAGSSTDVTHVMRLIDDSRAAPLGDGGTGPLPGPGGAPLDEGDTGPLPGPGAFRGEGDTGPLRDPGPLPWGSSDPGPGGIPDPVPWGTSGPGSWGSSGSAPWRRLGPGPRRSPRMGPPRRRVTWPAVLVVAVVFAFGLIGYELLSGSGSQRPTAAAPAASRQAASRHPAEHGSGTPVPQRTRATAASPAASPARSTARPALAGKALTPASAAAFGSGGVGQGDNADLAHLAVDSSPGSAWHTDWYTSATFGNLYSGTGLLLDLGHSAMITGVRISLGSAPGASFKLRAGSSPSPSALRTVARADGVSGLVQLRLSSPAHGRYLLIWFTRLPDYGGSFEASVHDVKVAVQG